MAVPKRRTSSSKRNIRRAANEKIELKSLSTCPHCGRPALPHRACPACGKYKGRAVTEATVEPEPETTQE